MKLTKQRNKVLGQPKRKRRYKYRKVHSLNKTKANNKLIKRVKKAFSESKVSKGVTMSESNRLDIISLSNVSIKSKILLLKEAGYGSDGTYVTKDKKRYSDPYTNKPVKISNMALLPGSVTVIDDNPFSLIEYLEEHNKEI